MHTALMDAVAMVLVAEMILVSATKELMALSLHGKNQIVLLGLALSNLNLINFNIKTPVFFNKKKYFLIGDLPG